VNIASRIEALATPGGICVSGKVYDEIKNQPELESKSLGLCELKNVKRPIEVFALTGEGLTVPDQRPAGKIRAVIVDDEELARKVLHEYLAAHPEIEVLAECSNGFEAVKAITELQPDLVFLDIQMPKLNGFEVLELIDQKLRVIFVTAYDEFALRAFEVHAIDYLLKPFSQERFDEALAHALETMDRRVDQPEAELAFAAHAKEKPLERVLVREGSRVHIIPVQKIDFIEAQDDYVCFRSEGKKYLKQETLSALEGEVDPKHFIRIHRSYIMNIERLAKIELYAKDSRVAILTNGTRLQVSRAGYAKLKQFL
jgi:two-component system LytT family response regulator